MFSFRPPIHLIVVLVAAFLAFGFYAYFSQTDFTSEANAKISEERFTRLRMNMVKYQIQNRGIKDKKVLEAMQEVKRHQFVPDYLRDEAYNDHPLPIGHDQTISQPYIVAAMTELIQPQPEDKVLEIGTGSGYQAAVLAKVVKDVYTIEIVEPLGKHAKKRLEELGYENVHVRIGDGYKGWPEEAPFDKIVVTAAPHKIPQPLVEQLKDNGRMVIPVGTGSQQLMLLQKKDGELKKQSIYPVRFVPMTGEVQEQR